MEDKDTIGKTISISIPGSIAWGIIFFIVGLIKYGDIVQALMLGLFAWISTIVALLFLIPVVGIILFIGSFSWGWGESIANALGLVVDNATSTAWLVPTIFTLVIGSILSLIVVVVVVIIITLKK